MNVTMRFSSYEAIMENILEIPDESYVAVGYPYANTIYRVRHVMNNRSGNVAQLDLLGHISTGSDHLLPVHQGVQIYPIRAKYPHCGSPTSPTASSWKPSPLLCRFRIREIQNSRTVW